MNTLSTPAHSQSASALPPNGFVRLPTILALIPVGKSLLWKMVERGDFPKPVKLSRRVTAWRSEDVLAFIASRSNAPAFNQVGDVETPPRVVRADRSAGT